MARLSEYCNVTTDLQNICKDIESYAYQRIDTTSFYAVSGENYSQQGQVGYVGALFVNKLEKTQASSLATIAEDTPWYYDQATDLLYLYTDFVTGYDISILSDSWGDFKDEMREQASQELENYFRSVYTIPFPFKRNSTMEFDDDIRKMTAIMTVINIIRADNPTNDILLFYNDMLWDNEQNNTKGLLQAYLDGRKSFSFEATRATFNGLVTPVNVTSSGTIDIIGTKNTMNYDKYVIKITTAGDVGTAKYSLTKNNVALGTFNTYIYYVNLFDDIYIKFTGIFELNNEWTIEFDGRKKESKTGLRSLEITI